MIGTEAKNLTSFDTVPWGIGTARSPKTEPCVQKKIIHGFVKQINKQPEEQGAMFLLS